MSAVSMENDAKEDLVEKIDSALANYYAGMDVKKYSHKFREFCNANGFASKDIAEELTERYDECMLVEFDPNFPLSEPLDGKRRLKEIFRVLLHAADKGTAPPARIQFNFDIPPKERTALEHEYKEQLPGLAKLAEKEPDLWHFLALGRHPCNNNVPFLTNMVDLYTRNKTQFIHKKQDGFTVEEWCSHHNRFMMDLKQTNPNRALKLKAAMVSYSNRIMCRLQFSFTSKIMDHIGEIAKYIVSVPLFIQKLITTTISVPFAVDLLVAVREVESDENHSSDADDEEEDDANTILYTDSQLQSDAAHTRNKRIGSMQEIKRELRSSNTRFYGPNRIRKDRLDVLDQDTRFLMTSYKAFRNILSSAQGDTGYDGNPQDADKDDMKKSQKEKPNRYKAKHGQYYPQRKRFEIFVDRRADRYKNKLSAEEKESVDDIKDEIVFFEPPTNCDTLPKNNVAEWYMEAARTCLIPAASHANTITAKDHLCGELLTFSYNVNQHNEIKCYIVWNGQTMRFHGDYIHKLLPLLFVKSAENERFIHSAEAQTIQREFDSLMPDPSFDNFCNQYG